ncbi:MAG: hypothetical protein QM490_01905 [Candidatus Gracilibacteria bacterium]
MKKEIKEKEVIVFNEKTKQFEKKIIKNKEFDYFEFIEYIFYSITVILFITFYSGITEYKYFIWFVILSFLFSILSNKFIMSIFNKDNIDIKEKNDKIQSNKIKNKGR